MQHSEYTVENTEKDQPDMLEEAVKEIEQDEEDVSLSEEEAKTHHVAPEIMHGMHYFSKSTLSRMTENTDSDVAQALHRSSLMISSRDSMNIDSKMQEVIGKETEYMLQHIYEHGYDAKKEKIRPAR